MSEYISLNDVIEIAEQQGHVTIDDLVPEEGMIWPNTLTNKRFLTT